MRSLGKIGRLFSEGPNNDNIYSFSKESYYENLKYPRDLEGLLTSFTEENKKSKEITKTPIQFIRHSFGSSMEDIIFKEGAPRFMLKKSYHETINHTTCFYKNKVGNHNAVSQLHFIDDSFYWGVFLFLNKLNTWALNDIKNVLELKYSVKFNDSAKDNLIVADLEKNMIVLKNEIYTTLNYISGNPQIREIITKKLWNFKQLSRVIGTQEKKRLFDIL